jgi:hypothetical protein
MGVSPVAGDCAGTAPAIQWGVRIVDAHVFPGAGHPENQFGPSFQRERNSDRQLLIRRDPSPFLAPLAPSRRFGDPSLRYQHCSDLGSKTA